MTRNPDRIPEVLETLEKEWKEHPDLRLGQLIHRLSGGGDVAGIEDNHLMQEMGEDLECDYWIGENKLRTFLEDTRKK